MEEIKNLLFDGTDDDFKRIVDSYKLLLYSVAYAASAHADADDIVQETFIYAYYHWGMLREKEKLSSWLCAIAKNKASHALRMSEKTVSVENLGDLLCTPSPEAAYLRGEERAEIRKKIDMLSERYRETLLLYYFAEKSISEIATLLEVPEGTVKFRLHEGREKLKKELPDMMNVEKKQIEEKNIWENIKCELERAINARVAYQKGKANALCDLLIEQFRNMDAKKLSKGEIRLMISVYTQKFYANTHLESREKNIIYIEKCVELAEILGDEGLAQNRYAFYACELFNIGKHKEALTYFENSLLLAEKLKNVTQIAALNYWIGACYSDIRDFEKAKDRFEKAAFYKDLLMQNDYGKYIYTLIFSAMTAIKRMKNSDRLSGFCASCQIILKTNQGLQTADQTGYTMGKYQTLCMPDVIAFVSAIKPFLSEDLCEGYSFEKDTFSRSKIPVRSYYEVVSMHARAETPAGLFENCLHVRYTDQTRDEVNFKINGVRNIFYAPDVGIVQAHFKAIGDWEYTLKLTEYEVEPMKTGELCDRYLPLAVGNVWYYDSYGADGTRFDKVDYENRFEVVSKCKNGTATSIAHSAWICDKSVERNRQYNE